MPLMRYFAFGAAALMALANLAAPAVHARANAPKPTLVQQHNAWELYTYDGQNGKVCFILSRPTRLEPTERDHGDVFFFITARPQDRVVNEASVIVGYTFMDNSNVVVDIDGQKFVMFVDRDGAWIENAGDEDKLVAAMRSGRSMVVTGKSSRGTDTRYTFSLAGVTASTNQMREVCR